MFAPGELLEKMRTQMLMIKSHNFDFNAIDMMTPFEFELYNMLILEHLEAKKKKREM